MNNKSKYTQPEITIVDFKVEHCFTSVFGTAESDHMKFSRLFDGDDYVASENYTSVTDYDGEFSTGSW